MVRCVVFSYHDASARVFVEAMDNAGAFFAANTGEIVAMTQQRVNQSMFLMPGAGVDDKASGLVQNDQVVVFKKDIQRNFFGLMIDLLQRRLEQPDIVALPNEIARPGLLPFKGRCAAADKLLDARARKLAKSLGQEPVEPGARRLFRHHQRNHLRNLFVQSDASLCFEFSECYNRVGAY
ncbi:MAG: hypothetical protein QOG67_637 [Verrucomicrobiota bacterium]